MRNATPRLEPLGPRDCPSSVIMGGTQAADVRQGQATDCMFLAELASAARQGVDLAARLRRVAPMSWRVDLFTPALEPASVPVRFTGAVTALDPATPGGEFWPVLFARAHRALAPWIRAGQGESAWAASSILFGRPPGVDSTVRAVGLEAMHAALARGSVVCCYSDVHAYAVSRVTAAEVVLYDPWHVVRRYTPAAFLTRSLYVAILDPAG